MDPYQRQLEAKAHLVDALTSSLLDVHHEASAFLGRQSEGKLRGVREIREGPRAQPRRARFSGLLLSQLDDWSGGLWWGKDLSV